MMLDSYDVPFVMEVMVPRGRVSLSNKNNVL